MQVTNGPNTLNFTLCIHSCFANPILKILCSWLFCCLQSLEVSASGTLCGSIKQSVSPFSTEFRICDATGKTVLLIKGPSKPYVLNQFKVLSADGKTEVGNVQSLLPNLVQGRLADADHFSISFSLDLDVNIKAVLLAALILIVSIFIDII